MKADTTGYDANIAKARRQLDQFKKDNLSMGGVMKQLSGNLLATAARFASITAAVGALGAAFKSNIETARNFEKSMSQLSSLTGMVGDDLGKLKEYAIELGSSTTLSASQVADAFKMIGSQQPQLLESGEALKEVTKYAITLSEAAGIELSTAAQTLSTSINQMGGDSDNAARYINVLAAASQKGAGDIAWLGEALTKSATAAKAVGTDYEELVANLEQLAKAGFDASTAGTALRSIIMNLENQANNDFKPSVVGLTQAFENLGKAHLDIVEYQGIVGKMFATQAMALANASEEAKNMTEAITGTNTAEEQAKTNTDNLDGALKGLASAWEGLNLHINSSNGLLRDAVDWLKDVVVWADKAIVAFGNVPNVDLWNNQYNLDNPNSKINQKPAKANEGKVLGTYTVVEDGAGNVISAVHSDASTGGSGKKKTKTKSTKSSGIDTTAKIQQQFDTAMAKANIAAEEMKFPDLTGPSEAWETFRSAIVKGSEEIGDSMNFTKWTKDFDPYTEKMNEMTKALKQQQMAFSMSAQAAANFGSALSSLDDPGAKAAGTVIAAIANIALGFGTAAVQASSMGPWGWIAYVAAGLGALATAISTVHSLTGYAEGGEIKGNSFSGDNLMAMGPSGLIGLNAGEIVLNKAQQATLANNLQNGGGQTVRVIGKISGTDIILSADRTLKTQGKQLAVWKG